ncbi:GLPGLI family protein [Flectobacillus major]|jgi:GLPGLI family protein|uniref:GLPGLI family protein n=1 Tax=Flectobacillus major TaxID=103 RepID=UPI00041583C9|nr:GLPGLI family protein [Flectobacillus major]
MRKNIIFSVVLCLVSNLFYGQAENKIIKVSYISTPTSQYQIPANTSRPQDEVKASIALKQGYKYHYTLYINPKTSQSLYKFERLNINKPKGQEAVELKLNDELAYCIKTSPKTYYKYESIFNRPFYSNGGMKDLEWSITNEKKNMLGFDCTKAIAKNKNYLISVWFTDKIPVSSGPSNYFGLPGLVIWSEDFFRTTQIEKIEYITEQSYPLEQEIAKIKADFDKNKKASEIQEKLFLEKKSELIKSMMAMMK